MSSSDSPAKSSSSDSKRQITVTPSVVDISSKSSFSNNNSSFKELRTRVDLLNIQLKQRDAELQKERISKECGVVEKEQIKMENEGLKAKTAALSTVCEDLHRLIVLCEEEDKNRAQMLEDFYRKHYDELLSLCEKLRSEKGILSQKLTHMDTKVSAVINENNYLRFEAKSLQEEVVRLQKTCEEKDKENCDLRTEVAGLKLNQKQLGRRQSAKIERTLQTFSQDSATKLAKLRLQYEDREKEYGITLTRVRNELEFLQSELDRRESQIGRLTSLLDSVTLDNKKLLEASSKQTKESEAEVLSLRQRLTTTVAEAQSMRDENISLKVIVEQFERGFRDENGSELGRRLNIAAYQSQLDSAHAIIRSLREQVNELNIASKLTNAGEVHEEYRKKCLQVCDLDGRIRELEKSVDLERNQRVKTTELLLEMSADMSILMKQLKDYEKRMTSSQPIR